MPNVYRLDCPGSMYVKEKSIYMNMVLCKIVDMTRDHQETLEFKYSMMHDVKEEYCSQSILSTLECIPF